MSLVVRTKSNNKNESFHPFFNELTAFDNFFGQSLESNNSPKVNIVKLEDRYEIQVAAPGFAKKDFSLEIKENKLVVSAKPESKKEENFIKKEFGLNEFKRTFTLNNNTFKKNGIEANYENGILTINLPMQEQAKAINKTIEIK